MRVGPGCSASSSSSFAAAAHSTPQPSGGACSGGDDHHHHQVHQLSLARLFSPSLQSHVLSVCLSEVRISIIMHACSRPQPFLSSSSNAGSLSEEENYATRHHIPTYVHCNAFCLTADLHGAKKHRHPLNVMCS